MLSGEPDALETMLSAPLAAPALDGAKVAVKVTLWLAPTVAGRVTPLTEKPAPLAVACVIVTALAPVLVKVSDLLLLLPTWILPNARLVGLAVSVPGVAPTPERLSTTLLFVFPAVVAKVTLPLKLPAPVGAKVIVTAAAFPACNVSGKARLLMANPAPLIVACEMVRSLPPLFVRVTVLVWFDPTLVFPKTTGEGLGESFPIVTASPETDSET
jgi:hypothetical protein